jgi:hypothetical protein
MIFFRDFSTRLSVLGSTTQGQVCNAYPCEAECSVKKDIQEKEKILLFFKQFESFICEGRKRGKGT